MYRDLELSDRARIIQMAVRSGITDLDTIEEVYNRFADGGSKPPYNGEIKQGKKWTPLDHYLADNPKVAHGFRKAGVLVSDLARLIPGITTREVEINPQKLSDYGDAVDIANQENDQDSFVDRMSEAGTYLGAIGRTVKPIVTRLKKDFPKWEWTPRITGMTDSFINTDRLINMGQFIDDFATPVEQFRDGGKIHIKPENRGKFTALKERTGKSASWFKAHGTPAQKKMATFALNARKWKHSDGGLMTKL